MSTIKIIDTVTDSYSNQINCEALVYLDNKYAGKVDYVLYDKELTVSWIFIEPKYRRMGLGKELMKYIIKNNPKYKYKPSLKTDLGAKFKF